MDDEFPIRNPGTNVAPPVQPQPEFRDSQVNSPSLGHGQEQHPRSPPPPPLTAPRRLESDLPPTPTTARLHKAEPTSNGRRSMATGDVSHIKDSNRPQRKQSTLRGALGKLFGRKKKAAGSDSPTNSDIKPRPVQSRGGQYRRSTGDSKHSADHHPGLGSRDGSDPRLRSRPFPGAESKRSASLPITEFDRALRSHSVRPEDVRAIESARNSLSADFGLSSARLSALSALRARESTLAGLSPRPASSHGRESHQSHVDENPEDIGRAITSDYEGSTTVRRRSRSLSGLPEVEEDHTSTRKRSDEIRYWRESYGQGSVPPTSTEAPQVVEPPMLEDNKAQDDKDEHPQTTREPFHFGTYNSMSGLEGMKITQAATLDTRVGNVENRVNRLEQVLNQVCNATQGLQDHSDWDQQAPAFAVNGYQRSMADRPSNGSILADNVGNIKTVGGPRPELGSPTPPLEAGLFRESQSHSILANQRASDDSNRPISTVTIRGAAGNTRSTTSSLTTEDYKTLMAIIQKERSAREMLEVQVQALGHQLSVLTNSIAMSRNADLDPPPTAKSFGDRSAFDQDGDDLTSMSSKMNAHVYMVDPEDSGIGTGHGDESEYSDTFETPREEGHNFGAFGEDLDEEHQARTKAARTLSLSQLTMGRRTQQQTARVI